MSLPRTSPAPGFAGSPSNGRRGRERGRESASQAPALQQISAPRTAASPLAAFWAGSPPFPPGPRSPRLGLRRQLTSFPGSLLSLSAGGGRQEARPVHHNNKADAPPPRPPLFATTPKPCRSGGNRGNSSSSSASSSSSSCSCSPPSSSAFTGGARPPVTWGSGTSKVPPPPPLRNIPPSLPPGWVGLGSRAAGLAIDNLDSDSRQTGRAPEEEEGGRETCQTASRSRSSTGSAQGRAEGSRVPGIIKKPQGPFRPTSCRAGARNQSTRGRAIDWI
ncbi:WAS/WASL-interacting protein family member 1-like [Anolis carolinensis]|uniref:WAS/WASL-interacting protein family member 1-like n=1 Tax=Anolis carolinensis TaxID=28377 RepID=UPI002F2B4E46